MPSIDCHLPGTPIWVDLMTPDPEKARAFYGMVFGWEFSVGAPETGFYTMATLRGNNVAGVGKQPENMPGPPAWNLYFGVESADKAVEKIKSSGGNVMMGPMDVMDQGRLAFCVDPVGAHFGLWQPMRMAGARLVNEPGAMTWHEVYTRDSEKARSFYAKVFDLTPVKLPGEMEYYTLNKGEKQVGGVMKMDERFPPSVPSHWNNYFAVESTDASAQRISELGGKVTAPPFDTPYGRIAVVADPLGAAFSIVQPPAKA